MILIRIDVNKNKSIWQPIDNLFAHNIKNTFNEYDLNFKPEWNDSKKIYYTVYTK